RRETCRSRVPAEMKTKLVVIQSDSEHAEAKAVAEKLLGSKDPANRARATAQVRRIEAYERACKPRGSATAGNFGHPRSRPGRVEATIQSSSPICPSTLAPS